MIKLRDDKELEKCMVDLFNEVDHMPLKQSESQEALFKVFSILEKLIDRIETLESKNE